ncbi:hypothetical protein GGF32_007693 [Allomyces javanicus]|nr:hypothetical protein GGF32_007693 [Allomyces javanicus]
MTQYTFEPDVLDSLFETHALFSELEAIRLNLSQAWAQYRHGKIDLIAASLVTNTALNWVRDAETRVIGRAAVFTPRKAMAVAGYLYCAARGLSRPDDLQQIDVVLDPAHRDVVDYMYARTYLLLMGRNLRPDGEHPGDLPPYNLAANRDAMIQQQQQYLHDMNLIMTVAPMCRDIKDVPAFQAFSFGVLCSEMSRFFETKVVTMTLVFVSQVLLNLHHDLRGHVACGEQSLSAAHAELTRSIGALRAHPMHSWPSEQKQVVDLFSVLEGLLNMCRILASDDMQFSLFRLHPWLCGHLEYVMREHVLAALISPTTPWRTLLYAGQLYEACCQYGRDIPGLDSAVSWVDMDKVMELYGKGQFFFGRGPDSPKEFVKSAHLMMGLSISDPIQTQARAYTSLLFRERQIQHGIKPVQLSTNFLLLLNLAASDLVASATIDASRFGEMHANFAGRALNGGSCSPACEHDLLRFDLLGLHVRCLNVLEAVTAIAKVKLDAQFGASNIEDVAWAANTAHLVGFLFKDWWFTTEEGARHYVKPGARPKV